METLDRPQLHEAFLERAAAAGEGDGGHALGAFLVMRLADHFAAGKEQPPEPALSYQVDSTRDYIRHLIPQTAETRLLLAVVDAARAAADTGSATDFWEPMLGYAAWLEQSLHTLEALDVIDTALRSGAADGTRDEMLALYQRARVLRKVSRYDDALDALKASELVAERLGDSRHLLQARIGRALVFQRVGNLPQARSIQTSVVADAVSAGDAEIEARGRHDLSNTLVQMRRPVEAVGYAFRAFELYTDPRQRLRALSDLGMAFKMLGNLAAAESAFTVVLAEEGTTSEMAVNTMLELLDTAALACDRVGFERWRRDLAAREATMNPDARVDFALKLGSGFARFRQNERAQHVLSAAVALAEEHKLNAYLFRAEEALRSMARGDLAEREVPADDCRVPGVETDAVAARLHALRQAVQ